MTLTNLQTAEDLNLHELKLKAHGFDIMREAEALQSRLNQLNNEKNNTVIELQKLYKYIETIKKQTKDEEEKRNNIQLNNISRNSKMQANQESTLGLGTHSNTVKLKKREKYRNKQKKKQNK